MATRCPDRSYIADTVGRLSSRTLLPDVRAMTHRDDCFHWLTRRYSSVDVGCQSADVGRQSSEVVRRIQTRRPKYFVGKFSPTISSMHEIVGGLPRQPTAPDGRQDLSDDIQDSSADYRQTIVMTGLLPAITDFWASGSVVRPRS